MTRLLTAILGLAVVPAVTWADRGPELTKPYNLNVVVGFGEHRLLTRVFKDRVKRELHDSLQAALGEMAKVAVVDLAADPDPRFKEVEAKGLRQALEEGSWKTLADVKTHFVLIDFADNQYVIHTRQHDGYTGLASPVVRKAQVWDPVLVASTAARLIDRDFGLVGTVVDRSNLQAVRLELKGGKLGVPLDAWLKKDDVFAIALVRSGSNGDWSLRVPDALLQVVDPPQEGVCRCRLLSRFKEHPWDLTPGQGVRGYRCLKLGTTTAPLRLHLVDRDTLVPILSGVAVSISPRDFDDAKAEGHAVKDGFVNTDNPIANVAFVRVLSGGSTLARIPVEILDDRPRVFQLSGINEQTSKRGEFERRRKRWEGLLNERLGVVSDLRKELNKLIEANSLEAALEKAITGRKGIEDDINGFSEELGNLKTAARDVGAQEKLLANGGERLKELRQREEEIKNSIKNLEEVIKQEPIKREALALVDQAKGLEEQEEYEQAIQVYEKALAKGVELPEKVRTHLAKLQQDWAVKSPEHASARKFIYETWPKLESASQLKERIDEAARMFQVCQQAADRLTPRMLLKANLAHVTRLNNQLEGLKGQVNEDSKKTAETITEVAEKLGKLTEAVTAYLSPPKPGAK
jgi:tetratricopeptide (TPR) repeat protein